MIRKTPLKRTPLKRSSKPINAKRSKPRRVSVFRSRAYLDWLKTQQCVVTRLHGFPMEIIDKPHLHRKTRIVDPAHGPPAGLRIKGPDNEAVPLTRYFHEEQTRIGWEAFERKYSFSRVKLAAEYYTAFLVST